MKQESSERKGRAPAAPPTSPSCAQQLWEAGGAGAASVSPRAREGSSCGTLGHRVWLPPRGPHVPLIRGRVLPWAQPGFPWPRGRERCGGKGTGAPRACRGLPRFPSIHDSDDRAGFAGCCGAAPALPGTEQPVLRGQTAACAMDVPGCPGTGDRSYNLAFHPEGEERAQGCSLAASPTSPVFSGEGGAAGEGGRSCWGSSESPGARAALCSFHRGVKRGSGRQSGLPRSQRSWRHGVWPVRTPARHPRGQVGGGSCL